MASALDVLRQLLQDDELEDSQPLKLAGQVGGQTRALAGLKQALSEIPDTRLSPRSVWRQNTFQLGGEEYVTPGEGEPLRRVADVTSAFVNPLGQDYIEWATRPKPVEQTIEARAEVPHQEEFVTGVLHDVVKPWAQLAGKGLVAAIGGWRSLDRFLEKASAEADLDLHRVRAMEAGIASGNALSEAGSLAKAVGLGAANMGVNVLTEGVSGLFSLLLTGASARDATVQTIRRVFDSALAAQGGDKSWIDDFKASQRGELTAYDTIWGERLEDRIARLAKYYRDEESLSYGDAMERAKRSARMNYRWWLAQGYDLGLDPINFVTAGTGGAAGRVTGVARAAGRKGTIFLQDAGARYMSELVNESVRTMRQAVERGVGNLNDPLVRKALDELVAGSKMPVVLKRAERAAEIVTKRRFFDRLNFDFEIVQNNGRMRAKDGTLVPVSAERVEAAKEAIRLYVDRGGIKLHYPVPTTGRPVKVKVPFVDKPVQLTQVGLEWRNKTVADAHLIRQALAWGALAVRMGDKESKVHALYSGTRIAAHRALGLVTPEYNAMGRVPAGLRGTTTHFKNRLAFLTAKELQFWDDTIRAHKLSPPEAETLRTALDAGRPLSNRLEPIRKEIEASELGQALANADVYYEAVKPIAEKYGIDDADAFLMIKAKVNNVPLDNERLQHIYKVFETKFEDELVEINALGRDVPEVFGGGFWPRIGAKEGFMENLGRVTDKERVANIDARDKRLLESLTQRVRTGQSRGRSRKQGLERGRTLFAVRNVDGVRKLASAKWFATAKRTTFDEWGQGLTEGMREHLTALSVKSERVESKIDTLLAQTGGLRIEELRQKLNDQKRAIAEFRATVEAPNEEAQKELRRLNRAQQSTARQLQAAREAAGYAEGADLAYGIEVTRKELLNGIDEVATWARMLDGKANVLRAVDMLKERAEKLELGSLRRRAETSLEHGKKIRPASPHVAEELQAMRHDIEYLMEQAEDIGDFSDSFKASEARVKMLRADLETSQRAMRVRDELNRLRQQEARTAKTVEELRALAKAQPGEAIADLVTREEAKLKELGKQKTKAKELAKAQTEMGNLDAGYDAIVAALEDEMEAMAARVPLGADEIFLQRNKVERAGLYVTGSRVRVAARGGQKGTVRGLIRKTDVENGGSTAIIDAASIPDLDKAKADYRLLVRMDDGELIDTATSRVTRAADYSHVTPYTKEKAFFDEIQNDFPGITFEPDVAVNLAAHARQVATIVTQQEFLRELDLNGYVVKMAHGEPRPGWVASSFEFLDGYEVLPTTEKHLQDIFTEKRRRGGHLLETVAEDGYGAAALSFIDRVQGAWKGTVTALFSGFHGTNGISNVWQNLSDLALHALNPRLMGIAAFFTLPGVGLEAQLRLWERRAAGMGSGAAEARRRLARLNEKVLFTEAQSGRQWTAGELRRVIKERNVALTGNHFAMEIESQAARAQGVRSLRPMAEQLGIGAAKAGGRGAVGAAVATGGLALASGVFTGGVAFAPITAGLFGAAAGAALPGALRVGRAVGSFIEDQARMVNFLANLQKYGDVGTAVEHTARYLFDYTDLSPFVRDVVRRFVPFATFGLKNFALQMHLLSKPGALARQAHLVDSFQQWQMEPSLSEEDIETLAIPDYHARRSRTVISRDNGGITLMNEFAMPVQQFMEGVTGLVNSKGMSGPYGASSLSPFVTLPLQLATRFNLFFDASTDKPQRVEDIVEVLNLLHPSERDMFWRWLEIGEPKLDADGNTVQYAQNGVGVFLMRNFPVFSRFMSEARGLMEEGTSLKYKLLDFGLGIDVSQLTQHDLERFQEYVTREMDRVRKKRERTESALASPYKSRVSGFVEGLLPDLEKQGPDVREQPAFGER